MSENWVMTFDEWKNLSPETRLRIERYSMDAERMARKVILHQDQTGITEADIEAAKRILGNEARVLPKENYVTVPAIIPPYLRTTTVAHMDRDGNVIWGMLNTNKTDQVKK